MVHMLSKVLSPILLAFLTTLGMAYEAPLRVVLARTGLTVDADKKLIMAPTQAKLETLAASLHYSVAELDGLILVYPENEFNLRQTVLEAELLGEIGNLKGNVVKSSSLSPNSQEAVRNLIRGNGQSALRVAASHSENLHFAIQEMATFRAKIKGVEESYLLYPGGDKALIRAASTPISMELEGTSVNEPSAFFSESNDGVSQVAFKFSANIVDMGTRLELAQKSQGFLLEQLKLARAKFLQAAKPIRDAAIERLKKYFKQMPDDRLPNINDLNDQERKQNGDLFVLGNEHGWSYEQGWNYLNNSETVSYTPEGVLSLMIPSSPDFSSCKLILIQIPLPGGP